MKTQYIENNTNGTFYYSDKQMTKLHREDGPAIERADGTKSWHVNGKQHREDGPAVEFTDGSKAWYLNGELHREDGPAFEWANGDKSWVLNGKRHREDGPAIECVDGTKLWYLNDEYLTEQEHSKRTKKVPTIEINGQHFTVEELNNLIKTNREL